VQGCQRLTFQFVVKPDVPTFANPDERWKTAVLPSGSQRAGGPGWYEPSAVGMTPSAKVSSFVGRCNASA
jgi:hypothetical protein